jgi:hypothetical protein
LLVVVADDVVVKSVVSGFFFVLDFDVVKQIALKL